MDDRNVERRKGVLLLESQLQDKMEARKGVHLETVRLKCLKRSVPTIVETAFCFAVFDPKHR